MSTMRPARGVHLLVPERVGGAGLRQKPQCTQSSIRSGLGARRSSNARETAIRCLRRRPRGAGSAPGRSAPSPAGRAPACPRRRSCHTSSAPRTAAGASSTTQGAGASRARRSPTAMAAASSSRCASASHEIPSAARPTSGRAGALGLVQHRASSACRPDTRTTTSVRRALERRAGAPRAPRRPRPPRRRRPRSARRGRLLVRGRAAEPREHGAGAVRPVDVERLHLQMGVGERRGHRGDLGAGSRPRRAG